VVVEKLKHKEDEVEIAQSVGELAGKRRSSRYEKQCVEEGVVDISSRPILSQACKFSFTE